MRAQDLFLILDDRVLIPQDACLIPQQLGQLILIPQDFLLVADNCALVGNDGVLFLDGRLRHCVVPVSAG